MKILLVDGYPIFRQSLNIIFKTVGSEVSEIKGKKAFMKIPKENYDVAIFLCGGMDKYSISLLKLVSRYMPTYVISYLTKRELKKYKFNNNIFLLSLKDISIEHLTGKIF